MTKQILFICLAFLAFNTQHAPAQDYPKPILHLSASNPSDTMPNDSVLFTEVLDPNWNTWGFLEITNLGSRPVQLSNFFLQGFKTYDPFPFQGSDQKVNLRGTLNPGKCYIVAITQNNYSTDAYGKLVWKNGIVGPLDANNKADTIFPQYTNMRPLRYSLFSRFINNQKAGAVDSTIIDVFNPDAISNISGMPMPAIVGQQPLWYFVRKTNVKKGTQAKDAASANVYWNRVRGTSVIDGEWLPVPLTYMRPYYCLTYTSYRNYGESNMKSIKSAGKVVIDTTSKTITLPYNISRDSVFREFNCAPNVTWHFKTNYDTAKYYVQTNDTIIFYLLGSQLREVKFAAKVNPEPQNSAEVAPYMYFNAYHQITKRYVVSQNNLPMDTIGNVPYKSSVDTLIKYLVFPNGSSYSLIHPNNIESPDVLSGSMLKIVSADKSVTKTYKIAMLPYNPNHIATVQYIVFPGLQIWTNSNYEPTDTFPAFNPNNTSYKITLPRDIKTVPAAIVIPTNGNAKTKITRALNLTGKVADRTMTIENVAEDDTTKITYTITFEVKHEEPALEYTPFFSDLGSAWGAPVSYATQVYNPTDEVLDMSDYVLACIDKKWLRTLSGLSSTANDWIRYDQLILRPGYIVLNDANNKPVYKQDLLQNITSIGPKSCYSMMYYRSYPIETAGSSVALAKTVDFIVYNNLFQTNTILGPVKDFWGYGWAYGLAGRFTGTGSTTVNFDAASVVLFKIKNDSVKDGLKPVNDFINDYEMVDVVSDVNTASTWKIYNKVNGVDQILLPPAKNNWNLYRKPSVYRGNNVSNASFGFGDDTHVAQSSEWVVYGYPGAGKNLLAADSPTATAEAMAIGRTRYKNHKMLITLHIAYLLSETYLISSGIIGEQTIDGVAPNTTVNDFAKNIIRIDSGIVFTIKNAAGTLKTGSDQLVTGDIVYTTSARGIDHVTYKISTAALNADALLKSTVYTVVKNGTTGTISNVPFGVTLKDFMDNISVPPLALASPLNAKGNLLSLLSLPTDSTKMRAGQREYTILGAGNMLEVKAQNGEICTYAIQFNKPTVPIVLSDIVGVNQNEKTINNVVLSSVSTFLSYLKTANGYKIKVVNKLGLDRADGTMRFDDRVVVYEETNVANSTTYYINYYGEDTHDAIPENKSTGINVDVYPNPTTDVVVVKANGLSKVTVSDITGRTILTKISSGNSVTIKLPKTNGLYMIKAEAHGKLKTIKVLKH